MKKINVFLWIVGFIVLMFISAGIGELAEARWGFGSWAMGFWSGMFAYWLVKEKNR